MAQFRVEYKANATFNVPFTGSYTIQLWGGGGAGGLGSTLFRGGGGKGGGYAILTANLTAGNSHNLIVGAGGAPSGGAGGNTVFRNAANSADQARAAGGNGGAAGTGLAAGAGATAHVTTHIGDTTYNGGNGFNGGAGGGGAGSTGAGGNATAVGTAGTGTSEGGGDGGTTTVGLESGGAGGGGAILSGAGLAGAQGKVVITWDSGTETVTATDNFSRVVVWNRTNNETATATDANSKAVATPKSDTVAVTYDGVIKQSSPLAYYRLDETSGTSMADSSGNGRTGTYTGSPTLNQTGLVPTDVNKAVKFTGNAQFGSIPYSSPLDLTTGFTLECWISPLVLPGVGKFVYPIVKGNFCYYLAVGSDGKLYGGYFDSGAVNRAVSTSTGQIVVGNKYYIAVKWDGSTITLYKNGAVVGTPLASSNAILTNSNAALVGFVTAGDTTASTVIDEAAIYNTPLSDATIAAHYAAGDRAVLTVKPNKSDSVTTTDSNVKAFFKNLADTVTAVDDIVLTLIFLRFLDDTVTASDAISKAMSIAKSDTATATDSFVNHPKPNKSDSVTATDEFSKVSQFNRLPEDTVTATDSLAKSLTLNFSDSISGSEPVTVNPDLILATDGQLAKLVADITPYPLYTKL